jgi:hypothetical protein
MTLTALAFVNGLVPLVVLCALAAVVFLGLRIDRVSNESSVVPAAPVPLDLQLAEFAEAA